VLRGALERALATLAADEPALLSGQQADFGHAARVAMRRARAALRVGRRLLGRRRATRLNAELRWAMQAIGMVRDLDVVAQALADTPDLAALLSRRRHAMLLELRQSLAGPRYRQLVMRLAETIEDLAMREGPAVDRPAARRAVRLLHRCQDQGALITAASPQEAVHAFRKSIKKLRYSLDMLKRQRDLSWYRQSQQALRTLQLWLGHYQDLSVRIDVLTHLADTLSTATPSASVQTRDRIARIVASADAERHAMARRFPAEFERFSDTIRLHEVGRQLRRLSRAQTPRGDD